MKARSLPVAVLTLAAVAAAAPIRVGILKGTGSGTRYWHTSMHPGADAIAAMLANPAAAQLNNPVIPPDGFSVTLFGPDSAQCSGNGCGPTTAQVGDFISALDSLEVVVVLNFVDIGSRINNSAHRARLVGHWQTKGVVSLHQSNDNPGTWGDWMNLGAVRMQSHPAQMKATLRLDDVNGAGLDPDWRFLNLGLPDSTRFHEEWFTFSRSGADLRAGGYSANLDYPPVVVTTNLDETTYEQAVASQHTMGGDHPMSWFRKFPAGGRFFYTALGHNTSTFDSVYFFRRQIYNAILWAAGVDSTGAVSVRGGKAGYGSKFADLARVSFTGSTLAVSVLHEGPHAVEVRSLDGRRVMARRGEGRAVHEFPRLRSGSVYAVSVTAGNGGRIARLVTIP